MNSVCDFIAFNTRTQQYVQVIAIDYNCGFPTKIYLEFRLTVWICNDFHYNQRFNIHSGNNFH